MIGKPIPTSTIRTLMINAGLIAIGSLLFSMGFPNFIVEWGLPIFAWVSLVPIVILIRRIPWWSSPLWGAVYGYLTYSIFNYWLATFNPVSFILVPGIYAGWFFLVFPLLSLADRALNRYSWILQLLIWCSFEIIRTKGFLGYSYGILGYSQYNWNLLISVADIFGVMGVSFLVAFPSFLIGGYIVNSHEHQWKRPGRFWTFSAVLWVILIISANIYGILSRVDYSDSPTWRPALIQHNINTWLSGTDAWEEALDILIEESNKALSENPDALIWSETAFVPAIEWHLKYRRDRGKVELIGKLTDFLEQQNIPIILGNNDAVQDAGKRLEYNAVLLFDRSGIINKYRKIHLVPFSEHFPYARRFPRLMAYIQAQGTPLYQNGKESTVFNLGKWSGPQIGPIICFEDTFGYLPRDSVRNGAEVLVNLTNDSWSPESVSAIQHMTMAIFRSVENRRSMIRTTTAGITSVIDPNGKILAKLEPFTQDYLIADVPVYSGRKTIYTQWGAWFESVLLILTISLSALALIILFIRKRAVVAR